MGEGHDGRVEGTATSERPRGFRLSGDEGLLAFADAALRGLRHDDGLVCFDRAFDDPELRGTSPRYTAMVLLGLLRRAASGAPVSVSPGDLHRLLHAHHGSLGVGDLGLLLWADVRIEDRSAAVRTLAELERTSVSQTGLGRLEGMEVAWLALGALEALGAGLPSAGVVTRALGELRRRQSGSSPLLRHFGDRRLRARLPNFATQIYGLLALAEAARRGVESDARSRGERLADILIRSRDGHFGWPWLFDADTGAVVERYEVYAVHQDAMAPMALLALAEVTGESGYAQAAVEGLRWGFGANEMGASFYDRDRLFAHRSIRRAGRAARADLLANTALALARRRTRTDAGGVELNTTCRPYHLGWILEAWSGREHVAEAA